VRAFRELRTSGPCGCSDAMFGILVFELLGRHRERFEVYMVFQTIPGRTILLEKLSPKHADDLFTLTGGLEPSKESPPVRVKRSSACFGESFSRRIVRPGIVWLVGSRATPTRPTSPLHSSSTTNEPNNPWANNSSRETLPKAEKNCSPRDCLARW
jgi:hypothetical protein